MNRTPPRLPSIPPSSFAALNDAFHTHYRTARSGYALDVPVFVVMADRLVLVRAETRVERPISPPFFAIIKSVAHLPPALFALVHRCERGQLPADVAARVEGLLATVARARAALDDHVGEDGAVATLRALLDATSSYGAGSATGTGRRPRASERKRIPNRWRRHLHPRRR